MQIVHFKQDPESGIICSATGKVIQSGNGYILWSETESKVLHLFLDGLEVEIKLLDCDLVTQSGYAYHISGLDYEGYPWKISLGDGQKYNKISIQGNEIFVTKQQVVDLFSGRSFHEVLTECVCRFVRKQKIGTLKKEAKFAKKSRKLMAQVLMLKGKDLQSIPTKLRTAIGKLLAGR